LGGKHADGTDTPLASSENLKIALSTLLDEKIRKQYSINVERLVGARKPAEYIANLIFSEVVENL